MKACGTISTDSSVYTMFWKHFQFSSVSKSGSVKITCRELNMWSRPSNSILDKTIQTPITWTLFRRPHDLLFWFSGFSATLGSIWRYTLWPKQLCQIAKMKTELMGAQNIFSTKENHGGVKNILLELWLKFQLASSSFSTLTFSFIPDTWPDRSYVESRWKAFEGSGISVECLTP